MSPRSDIVSSNGFASQTFRLFERQEFSRTAGGRTIGKSLGSPLWVTELETYPLPNAQALDFEARLNMLDGVIGTFYAGDLRRMRPAAYANGGFTDAGVEIHTVGENGKSLRLKGLGAGFILTRGDYLSFDYGVAPSRALHQVVESVVADGSGVTPLFEIRPHWRPGVAVDTPVKLNRPEGEFALNPDSLKQQPHGPFFTALSFSATQVL